MTRHTLPASPETVAWGYFDATRAPVLTVAPGDTVTMDTVSGEPKDMPPEGSRFPVLADHRAIHAAGKAGPGPHFMTGPVAVEGARPGDVLEVKILAAELRQDWGWNVIKPLMGTLPEDFPALRHAHIPIDRERMTCRLDWGLELPLAPFFGVLGVAPPPAWGRVGSVEPREHGGNMDLKELVAGTALYLPVFVDGALFSAGDGHGVQGDGEVCVSALETPLTGTFELNVRRDFAIARPQAETADAHITMGFDPDLDDAAKTALRDMIALIVRLRGLSPEDAYMLTSLACDMRITQLVDGNKGVHAVLPKSALA